ERVPGLFRLGRARGERAGLALDLAPELRRLRARLLHRELRARDLGGDLPVLLADPGHVLRLREGLLDRGRAEHHVERRDVSRLEDRDEALVQPVDGQLVLPLQELEPRGLETEELVQLAEALLAERQVLLEGLELE